MYYILTPAEINHDCHHKKSSFLSRGMKLCKDIARKVIKKILLENIF